MSDDEEHRRPDETSEFSPFDDEDEVRPIDGPSKGDEAADSTRILPPATAEDATQVTPRPGDGDATSVLPASGTPTERHNRTTDTWADAGGPVWAGRAGVRPPRPGSGDDFTPTDWSTVRSDEPHGKWWMPIVVGIVGLILLGLLTWGIYLIAQADGRDTDTTPDATTSAAPPETTEPSGSVPPSTAPTTTQPTSASVAPPPGDVTIPALVGLSAQEARAALDRKGMSYRLRFVSADAAAGTVIDSDPAEGQQVPADTVVTLIIAQPPASSAVPSQPAPSQSAPSQQGGN